MATTTKRAKLSRCGHHPIHVNQAGECRHQGCPEGNRNGLEHSPVEYKSDDRDPQFLFSLTHTELLLRIASGELDPVAMARRQLANRGLGTRGEWLGFKEAEALWTKRQTPKMLWDGATRATRAAWLKQTGSFQDDSALSWATFVKTASPSAVDVTRDLLRGLCRGSK